MFKLNKITKSIITAFLATIILLSSIGSVKAASDTITLGDAPKTNGYIAGVTFHYKKTTDGTLLYCLDIHKKTAKNIQATLVRNSSNINGGIVHILKNGYPNKSITGDADKDYYITQTAIWWYLDNTTGSTNLGEQFKKSGSDPYGMRQYVEALVNEGLAHRNDSVGIKDPKLVISAPKGDELTLKDNYYISKSIKATTIENISSYNVKLTGVPSGTKIVKSDGKEVNYSDTFKMNAKESFKIKIPAQKMTKTKLSIKATATATGDTQYMAYEYQPVDGSMQNVALLEKSSKNVTSKISLEATSTKVSIVKVDSKTKKPIAGAHLVLKDANGREITSWVSTTNAHVIRNLANGKYTIEETKAPKGYLRNTKITTFEVSDTNRSATIRIENAPKNVVVNITKIDQETNSPLAGAVLLVKDSTGKEVVRFTTTTESYVLTDLANGTYTVEEVSAPEGYIKSDEKITFTVDDEHLSHQIVLINAKETYVPDTASVSSIIMIILGIVITGLGVRFIYKNGQRA